MMFEYKVVPAPAKGTKAKGVKTPQGRFAVTIEQLLNDMGAEGWEFQRAELLPSEERSGLTGSTTNWRNVMVFRRPIAVEVEEVEEPEQEVEQELEQTSHAPDGEQNYARDVIRTAIAGDPHAEEGATPVPGAGAREMSADNGVEELSPVSGMTSALKNRAKRQKDE